LTTTSVDVIEAVKHTVLDSIYRVGSPWRRPQGSSWAGGNPPVDRASLDRRHGAAVFTISVRSGYSSSAKSGLTRSAPTMRSSTRSQGPGTRRQRRSPITERCAGHVGDAAREWLGRWENGKQQTNDKP